MNCRFGMCSFFSIYGALLITIGGFEIDPKVQALQVEHD